MFFFLKKVFMEQQAQPFLLAELQEEDEDDPRDPFVEYPYFSDNIAPHHLRDLIPLVPKLCSILENSFLPNQPHVRSLNIQAFNAEFPENVRVRWSRFSVQLIVQILFHLAVHSPYYYHKYILEESETEHPLFDVHDVLPCSFKTWLQKVKINDYVGFIDLCLQLLVHCGSSILSLQRELFVRNLTGYCGELAYFRSAADTPRQYSSILGEVILVCFMFQRGILPLHMTTNIFQRRLIQDYETSLQLHRQLDLKSVAIMLLLEGEFLEQLEMKDRRKYPHNVMYEYQPIATYYAMMQEMLDQYIKFGENKTVHSEVEAILKETSQLFRLVLQERNNGHKMNLVHKYEILNENIFKTHHLPRHAWNKVNQLCGKGGVISPNFSDCEIHVLV